MKLKFWKRSQKKPYETGYIDPSDPLTQENAPRFRRGFLWRYVPQNSAARWFEIWGFYGLGFAWMLSTALLVSWAGNAGADLLAEIAMSGGLLIGFLHLAWFAVRLDRYTRD